MDEQKLLRRKSKALKENNKTLLTAICTDLAKTYEEEAKYEAAITEYTLVAQIYKEQNNLLQYAIANRAIGEVYLEQREYTKAIQHQTIYYNIAKDLKNKLEEQRALATIGHVYLTWYLQSSENKEKNLSWADKCFNKGFTLYQSLTGELSKLDSADMLARLFSNLGLVQDCLGNTDRALELINKSINLCKLHDIYEQLLRGYTSLASILERQGDHQAALQQYNLAVETATKMRDKPALLSGALYAKAEGLVKLGDFHGAKGALLKAHKLKVPNVKEQKTIEHHLRVVTSMSYTEDKLVSTNATNYKELKSLYEQMGDGACEIKCYKKAIDYYKIMLEVAKKAKLSTSELGTCYFCIAETYKDNGQFEESLQYYELELETCRGSFKGSLTTLCKIVDAKAMANKPVADVKAVYERAFQLCQDDNNTHEEGRMLKRCINYLRQQDKNSEALLLEKRLNELDYHSSDDESETSEAQPGTKIWDDIDINNITDASESDTEQATSARLRRRTKNFKIKRNLKGETPLHTACIKGQMNVVHHLLEQGHPVNIRDNSGWLPLHEACYNGHIEIVSLLLEKGAVINDRGGIHCTGTTPMHEAAFAGHLEVVRLLLDKGANAVARTDKGDTVLDDLKKWRSTVMLDRPTEELYQSLFSRLSLALNKAGQVTSDLSEAPKTTSSDYNAALKVPPNSDLEKPSSSSQISKSATPPISNLRRSASIGLDELPTSSQVANLTSNRSKSTSADLDYPSTSSRLTQDYRNVMDSFRRKEKSPSKPVSMVKRPGVITVESDDDWLEDDIGQTCKKRKTNSPAKSPRVTSRRSSEISENSRTTPRRSSEFEPTTAAGRTSALSGAYQLDLDDEDFAQPSRSDCVMDEDANSRDSSGSEESLTRRTTQSSLLDAGFSYQSGSRSQKSTYSSHGRRPRKQQAKLTSFGHTRTFIEADSSPSHIHEQTSLLSSNMQAVIDPTASVDVRINGKLYRVPVLFSQINSHTIKWLAEEAANRYARKEYTKPTLELETSNGAVLADDDLISLLFPMGAAQSEPVEARIIKWNIPPLIDRFKEACHDMNITPDPTICRTLEELSISLDLANKGLRGTAMAPLCKAINRQTHLLELDLSGNFISADCLKLLSTSLSSLQNLNKLNLSGTGLTSEDLNILSEGFTDTQKLTHLDISDNYVGDESLQYLAKICQNCNLNALNLSLNKLTKEIFNRSYNSGVTLSLKNIESLDVSDNELSNSAIIKIMSWVNSSVVKKINLSRNVAVLGLVRDLLVVLKETGMGRIALHELKLSRCQVEDSELIDVLRYMDDLEVLDLSYNNGLTGIALKKLLQSTTIRELNLCGCSNIFKYFEGFSQRLEGQQRQLKLSMDTVQYSTECGNLTSMWEAKYGANSVVEQTRRFFSLSVK